MGTKQADASVGETVDDVQMDAQCLSNMDEFTLDKVAFIGNTLSPFFLEDPRDGNAGGLFASFASLNAEAAAEEWPFVNAEDARRSLSLMVSGLSPSLTESGSFEADSALTWEYRRLFVGPAALPAPPWGSVYTDRECVIFGQTTTALHEWMLEHGVVRNGDSSSPDDHIGLMLGLMAWIARDRSENLEEYLSTHLLTWASHYLGELLESADHPFYKGLAQLTKLSLDGIQQALSLDVVAPHFYR